MEIKKKTKQKPHMKRSLVPQWIPKVSKETTQPVLNKEVLRIQASIERLERKKSERADKYLLFMENIAIGHQTHGPKKNIFQNEKILRKLNGKIEALRRRLKKLEGGQSK